VINAISPTMFEVPATISIEKITAEDARNLIANLEPISAVGHQATTDILNLLLHSNLATNRIQVKMAKGDQAILFGLARRLEEGRVLKTVQEIEEVGYSLYLLKVN